MKYLFLAFAFGFLGSRGIAQDEIALRNPSFEDIPHQGEGRSTVYLWSDCGAVRFPAESPPDIHPGNFWGVNIPSDHEDTYLGMVVRETETYEGVAQRLESPMLPDQCYELSVSLAMSTQYNSPTRLSTATHMFTTPAVFRIHGGTGICAETQLLATSDPVTHEDWRRYTFKLEPNKEYRYILIEAFYKTPSPFPYNGNILVDNLSVIKRIDCDIPLASLTEQEEERWIATPEENKPARKPRLKKKVEEEEEIAAIEVPEPEEENKILKELDIKTVKKGQTILVENLYFDENSTEIKEKSFPVLDEIYEFLQTNPDVTLEIGGHTNGRPSFEFANELSQNRANAVAQYLKDKGISGARLTAKGYGKSSPIASNRTEQGLARNQRVEIKILSLTRERPRW